MVSGGSVVAGGGGVSEVREVGFVFRVRGLDVMV